MTVFFQHVGDQNSARDFPRTIGTTTAISMSRVDLGPHLDLIPEDLVDFQIWGIPSGASQIYEKMEVGDWFLLVGTIGDGGGVEYIGKIIYIVPGMQRDLSKYLWTEERFPWIFAMRGEIKHVPWPIFLDTIGYAPNFDPRGRIFGVSRPKMRAQGYRTDFDLVEAIRSV